MNRLVIYNCRQSVPFVWGCDVGLLFDCDNPSIWDSVLRGNQDGIRVDNTAPTLVGNRIADNRGWGIYHTDRPQSQEPWGLAENTITGNMRGVRLPASAIPDPDESNVLLPNQINGFWILGDPRNEDLTLAVQTADGVPGELGTYHVTGNLEMGPETRLDIGPGVVVKFAPDSGLTVGGEIWAQGKVGQPIAFTSERDDRFGGDLNRDGQASAPARGDWGSITLSGGAGLSSFEHVIVQYGGGDGASINAQELSLMLDIASSRIVNSMTDGVSALDANLYIHDTELYGHGGDAVSLNGSSNAHIDRCRLFANAGDAIRSLAFGEVRVTASELFGNGGFGIRTEGLLPIEASDNWWGSPDGPGGAGPGTGDEISMDVALGPVFDPFGNDFRIFGSSFSYFNAGPNLGEGTLGVPMVLRGTSTTEWGPAPAQTALHDPMSVILTYGPLLTLGKLELLVTTQNRDDASAIGGNIQSVQDGEGRVIHGPAVSPNEGPTLTRSVLPVDSYTGSPLDLQFVRESGLRAVVVEVWLVESAATEDQEPPVSAIDAPQSGAWLSGAVVEIYGRTQDQSELETIEIGMNNGIDTVWHPVSERYSDGAWSHRWIPPADGVYTLFARARDRFGNVETAADGVDVTIDRIPPAPVADLFVADTPDDQGQSLTLTWIHSADDDVVRYEVERGAHGAGTFEPLATVPASRTEFVDGTAQDALRYDYRITVVDQAGNRAVGPVAGPAQSTDDLPPEEITELQTVPDYLSVSLHWTPSVDSAGDAAEQWLDVSTNGGATWGAQAPDFDDNGVLTLDVGTDAYRFAELETDQTYRFRVRARDTVGNTSPSVSTNDVMPLGPIAIPRVIDTDVTWAPGVYYAPEGTEIAEDATLTLEPGVIVKLGAGTALRVFGALVAVGEPDRPIVFTAFADDEHGGDTNDDGPSEGVPGDWEGITFTETSDAQRTQLAHIVVRYGRGVSIRGVDLSIRASEISHNASWGIHATDCAPVITGSLVVDNEGPGVYLEGDPASLGVPRVLGNIISGNETGLLAGHGRPEIHDNFVVNNQSWGVDFEAALNAPVIIGNTVTGNLKGARLPGSAVPNVDHNNVLLPNQYNGLWILGNYRPTDLHLQRIATDDGMNRIDTYLVDGGLIIEEDAEITVGPGVAVKFASGAGLTVFGGFSAIGTPQAPVAFTSEHDDLFGGDLNGDGSATTPQRGDWAGIELWSTDELRQYRFEHAVIQYGGDARLATLYVDAFEVWLSHVRIANSAAAGLRGSATESIILDDCEVYGNAGDGIHVESGSLSIGRGRIFANAGDGIDVETPMSGGDSDVYETEIFANAGLGVLTHGDEPVDARNTWWGDPTGPSGAGGGHGDEISAGVNFAPFLRDGTEYHDYDAGGVEHGGFVLGDPQVSGVSSTEWGDSPELSIRLEPNTGRITAEYTDLPARRSYRLFVTYVDMDPDDQPPKIQTLTTGDGTVIHGPLTLPRSGPVQYQFGLPHVDGGSLVLHFDSVEGSRTVVSRILLLGGATIDTTPPVVVLNWPEENMLLAGGTIEVLGSADDGSRLSRVELGVAVDEEAMAWTPVDALNAAGAWLAEWNVATDGVHHLQARATDAAGNRGESSTVTVIVDATPPRAVPNFEAQPVDDGLQLSWALSPDDGAGQDDVVAYEILRRSASEERFETLARLDAGATQHLDRVALDNTPHHYIVRTHDRAGLWTDSEALGPLQWDGTPPEDVTHLTATATHRDQNGAVYVTWTPSEDSAGDLAMQRLYVSIGDSGVTGNNPPNFDNDQPIELPASSRSFLVTDLRVGQDYTFRLAVVDTVTNESDGVTASVSITGEATEYVVLWGTLQADVRLDAGVFVIDKLVIPTGVTLRLGPGVVFKLRSPTSQFAHRHRGTIEVAGALEAVGVAGNPVVFTAFRDDSVAGDTDGGGPSTGTPGAWRHIRFEPDADTTVSRLEHAVIRYGGKPDIGGPLNQIRANLYLESAVPMISCEVHDSQGHGVEIRSASPWIRDNRIHSNGGDGLHAYTWRNDSDHGVRSRIENNVITGNQRHGIRSTLAVPAIVNNEITDNGSYGVYFEPTGRVTTQPPAPTGNTITGNVGSVIVPANAIPDASNVLTPNARSFVGVRPNVLDRDIHFSVRGAGTVGELRTYVVLDSGVISVPAGLRLTVDPGAIVKFASGAGIDVLGALTAAGSQEDEIIFTSVNDPHTGGYPTTEPDQAVENGDWLGIAFHDTDPLTGSRLDHVAVRYAGVLLDQAAVPMTHCEIANSRTHGIEVISSSPVLSSNRIWGNDGSGIHVRGEDAAPILTDNHISSNRADGLEIVEGGRPTATDNQIFANHGYGLRNDSGLPIEAPRNWWGDVDGSGPLHPESNPEGTGSRISDDVRYAPHRPDVGTQLAHHNFSVAGPSVDGSMAPPVLVQGAVSDQWDETDLSPSRTMAWHAEEVVVAFHGLDPDLRYRIRFGYFSGGGGDRYQRLTDGEGNSLHGRWLMPDRPVLHELRVPSSLVATDGELTLRFVNDNPMESTRAAVSEIYLIVDESPLAAADFVGVEYNDVDGSGSLTMGDAFHFQFSAPMDTSGLVDDTTDANERLVTAPDRTYGVVNRLRWSADAQTAIVELSEGFTVEGEERVSVVGLVDAQGHAVTGHQILPVLDTVAPHFVGLDWLDIDGSGRISLGDQYVFSFDEAINARFIRSHTTRGNQYLPPLGGGIYGQYNIVMWSADSRQVTLILTDGFTVRGDELVVPSRYVVDFADLPVVGTQRLSGRDVTPPELTEIRFDDADGNGAISIGDRYTFRFSESLETGALRSQTAEANVNLSPAGRRYGQLNDIAWNVDATEVTVAITPGFTIEGTEEVDPSVQVVDLVGNPVSNSMSLHLNDRVGPTVHQANGNYLSPLSATDTYRVTIQFNGRMDPAFEPLVEIETTGDRSPVVPAGGDWLSTRYPDDTYTTPNIVLDPSMDGTLQVHVTQARDHAGNEMTPAPSVLEAVLDATPPANPAITVARTTCGSAVLRWPTYAAPSDLAGFQIYRAQDGSFDQVDGQSFVEQISASARQHEVTRLAVDTTYDLAVVAFDQTGNFIPNVTSHAIRIDQPVPPAVAISLEPTADPDAADVHWHPYDTTSICGIEGFRIYVQDFDYDTVDGLAPVASVDANARAFSVTGLDRRANAYIAVVAFNTDGEINSAVDTVEWSDPAAGRIVSDVTLGAGEQREIVVNESIVVEAGATLTITPGTRLLFAPNTGIAVTDGRLVADGTPFDPIILTSANQQAPAPGDWSGVRLEAGASDSQLRHVTLEYGHGLHLAGCAPVVDALTAVRNAGAGLSLAEGAALDTTEALIRFNAVGLSVQTDSTLTLSGSVIKSNSVNATSDGTVALGAAGNWWGTTDLVTIGDGLSGPVETEPFLEDEPILSPAIGVADHVEIVAVRQVDLLLPGRNAEEMRISEDVTFEGVFFEPWAETARLSLSPNGGNKTIYAQFRSATGFASDPVSVDVRFATEMPIVEALSLSPNQMIHRPLMIRVEGSAVLEVAAIEVEVNGVRLHQASSSPLTHRWDVRQTGDGRHVVRAHVHDRAGNVTTEERNVVIELRPPPAPVITAPASDQVVAAGPVTVLGTAEPGVPITVRRNGFVVGTPVASEEGTFRVDDVPLVEEGAARFVATAQDTVGVSAGSNTVTVVLDSGPPVAVILNPPTATAGRGVSLQWKHAEEGEPPTRFQIYRHTESFVGPEHASLIDETDALRYRDESAPNGTLHYAVLGFDAAGNASALSNEHVVRYDDRAPSLTVELSGESPFGPGEIDMRVVANEALAGAPTLTVTPAHGAPTTVPLVATGPLDYGGVFEVTGEMASGRAVIRASATDMAGNRFVGRPSPGTLVLDTVGPTGAITILAAEPIEVTHPVEVTVELVLTEPAPAEQPPELVFAPPTGEVVEIALSGAAGDWQGVLPLTPAMGSGFGQFSLSAQDERSNLGSVITVGERLEIYDTPTPEPTAAPENLRAEASAAGVVRLAWHPVERAETYTLYRGVGRCEVATCDQVIALELAATEYADTPPEDGEWCYVATASRRGAESELSNRVGAVSDRVPPSAAVDVEAALGARGVVVSWRAPNEDDRPVRYQVERDGAHVRTVSPARDQIEFEINDHPPIGGAFEYTVVAFDAAGNLAVSEPAPFALQVGAVIGLEAVVNNDDVPLLIWESGDPETVGYHVYRYETRLNEALLVDPSFEDHFFAGASRAHYAVTAVNAAGEESPRRTIDVFPLGIRLVANPDDSGASSPLVVRYFNRLAVSLENLDGGTPLTVEQLAVRQTLNGEEEYATTLTAGAIIPPGGSYDEVLVVPLGQSTADRLFQVTVAQSESAGGPVTYLRHFVQEFVRTSGVSVEMSIDDVPLAGGLSTVNLCVNNHGHAAIDIVVNRDNGRSPGDVYVAIRNEENLEIARAQYRGYPGQTRILGDTAYVQIDPGDQVCMDVSIIVPENLEAGAVLTFLGVVEHFVHDIGGIAVHGTEPLVGRMSSGITQAEYYGSAQADRDTYANGDVVVITGQAMSRATEEPVPEAPLRLGFYLRGFKWYVDIATDETGAYRYEFEPPAGLAGEVTLWAAHPSVIDTIEQDQFTFYRMFVAPPNVELRFSKADTMTVRVNLVNPADIPLHGVEVVARAYVLNEQGDEVEIDTIRGSANIADGYAVTGGGRRVPLDLQIAADIDAPDVALVDYTITTREGAMDVLHTTARLREAVPILKLTEPRSGYVDVSVNRGEVRSATVTVTNDGLAVLEDAELRLPEQIGWISTNRSQVSEGRIEIGDLEVGESFTFDVILSPGSDVEQGRYTDHFILTGSSIEVIGQQGAGPWQEEETPTRITWQVDRHYGLRFAGQARVYHADLNPDQPFEWDGRTNAGHPVTAGWYTLRITVTDGLGRSTSAVQLVHVDQLLPGSTVLSLASTAPQREAHAAGRWVVWQDQQAGNWDIYARPLDGEETDVALVAGGATNQERPRTDGRFVVWEDRQSDGTWDIWARSLGDGTSAFAVSETPDLDEKKPVVYWPWVVYQARPSAEPDAPWQLMAHNLTTQVTEAVDPTGLDQLDPAVHGEIIVWQDHRDPGWGEIYLKDLQTGEVQRLTDDPGGQYYPVVFEQWVVWSDNRRQQFDLYGYNLRRGLEVRLTDTPENETHPDLHGKWVLYEEDSSDVIQTNLQLLSLDNLASVQLTNTATEKEKPSLASGQLVWTDQGEAPQGYPQVRVGTMPNLVAVFENQNAVAITQGMVDNAGDAYGLLQIWHEQAGVIAITRYTSLVPEPVAESAQWNNGGPDGERFPLVTGDFVWVRFDRTHVLDLAGDPCNPPALSAGVNAFGFACFPDDYSAYRLLRSLGVDRIKGLRMLDAGSGRWSVASVVDGAVIGENFSIPRIAVVMLDMKVGVDAWTP